VKHDSVGRRPLASGSVPTVLATALLVLALAGCGAPTPAASDPVPSAASDGALGNTDDSPCNVLDDETVESLLGQPLTPVEVKVPGTETSACQYGDITDHGIQVIHLPADAWAQSLPAALSAIDAAGAAEMLDPAKVEKAKAAAEIISQGGTIAPEEGCEHFSTLVEIQGMEPGSNYVVNFVPTQESPIAVTAQQCVHGTFTSLLVGSPEMAQDPAVVPRLLEVLADVAPRS
jgi:hypothetical protein